MPTHVLNIIVSNRQESAEPLLFGTHARIPLSSAVDIDVRVIPRTMGLAECDASGSQALKCRAPHRIKRSQRRFVAGQQVHGFATGQLCALWL